MADNSQDNEETVDTIECRLEEFKRRAIDLHDGRVMREEVGRRMSEGATLNQAWEEAESAYWNWWAE